jgi:uncharacterized protein YbbC (DUF1343 family)
VITIISLRAITKPNSGQLAGIDIMIFDLQDVELDFTYISSLHYEACAENNIPLIILTDPT